MRRALIGGALLVVAVAAGVFLVGAVGPLRATGLPAVLSLPAACLGVRCVTFREWSGAVRAAEALGGPSVEEQRDPARLLTELLTRRAALAIARRSGLTVSGVEVEQARSSIRERVAGQPGVEEFLRRMYGDLSSPVFLEGLRDLLLREKLRAAGVANVWEHEAVATPVVFHVRYRWDQHAKRVVVR